MNALKWAKELRRPPWTLIPVARKIWDLCSVLDISFRHVRRLANLWLISWPSWDLTGHRLLQFFVSSFFFFCAFCFWYFFRFFPYILERFWWVYGCGGISFPLGVFSTSLLDSLVFNFISLFRTVSKKKKEFIDNSQCTRYFELKLTQ